MMEKRDFHSWRDRVVSEVGVVCESVVTCTDAGVRATMETSISESQWDLLLSMARCERAVVWSEERWLEAQVKDECAVWVDFPVTVVSGVDG